MYSYAPGFGKIELVSYYPQFSSYYPACEQETKAWVSACAKPDWVVFDVGANIGYYTIQFSKLGQKVYAFEPTETISMLRENIAHHQCRNVEIVEVAVGDKNETREDLVFQIWGDEPVKKTWRFITLDTFVKQQNITKLDFIKIDVDSYDLDVLKGAVETIKTLKPFVCVELNRALEERNLSVMEAHEWLYDNLGITQMLWLDGENYLFKYGSTPKELRKFWSAQVFFKKKGQDFDVRKKHGGFIIFRFDLYFLKPRLLFPIVLRVILPQAAYQGLKRTYHRWLKPKQ